MTTSRWMPRALAAVAAACVGLTLALGAGNPAQADDWLHFTAAKALDGAPTAIAVDGTDIYVAGAFSNAGTVAVAHIAKYDTTSDTWTALGTGADQGSGTPTIKALAVDTSTNPHSLYVGGNFTQMGGVSASDLAKWDCSSTCTWTSVAPTGMQSDYSGGVQSLALDGTILYAGGTFHFSTDTVDNMMKWDTTTPAASGWSKLDGYYVNSSVTAITVDTATTPHTVYIGGDFTSYPSTRASGGSSIYNGGLKILPAPEGVAKWDSSHGWSAVDALTCSTSSTYSECGVYDSAHYRATHVYGLVFSSGSLYVAGQFSAAGGVAASQVAKYDGTSWTQLGDGLTPSYYGNVTGLLVDGTSIYASGGAWTFTGYTYGAGLAVLDTTAGTPTWAALGTNDTVPGAGVTLAKVGSDFYSFYSSGNIQCRTYVAKLVATGAGSSCALSGGGGGGGGRGGGGGGGGGGSSSSTTTTTTTTVVTVPTVAAIPPGTNANIPTGGLTPGSSVLLIDGVATTVTIKPDQPVKPKSLVATGDGFTLEVEGQGAAGQPLGLTNDAALRLENDHTAKVKGTGFAPNADVQVHIFSTAQMLGTIRTDATGAFNGTVSVPANIELGHHTLQIDALTTDNKVRSLSLGVVLEAPAKPERVAKATVAFGPLSTTLTSSAKATLMSLAKKTKATATGGLVVGYVQKDGNLANNTALSTQRAKVIASFLKANGVKAALSTQGNGAISAKNTGRIATVSVSYTG